MSSFSCPVVKLGKIGKHPNADNLSITTVEGGPCIFKAGDFQPGDLAIYIPVEAVVPLDNPYFAFLKDPNHPNRTTARVKAKKLRGIFSMGLLIPYEAAAEWKEFLQPGDDLQHHLKITKYVEPEAALKIVTGLNEKDPGFMPVYDVESYRKFSHVLVAGERVSVTEKIHGCNGRWSYGSARGDATRLWVGSHNCVKKLDPEKPCLWWRIALDLKLEEKLKQIPGLVVYGEVYGQVQDLKYGTGPGQIKLAVFDVYDSNRGRFLDWDETVAICDMLDLPMVPTLYVGPYHPGTIEPMADGKSTLADNIREGIVIKPTTERWHADTGRVIVKLVSQNYLLRKNGTEAQ